MRSVTGVTRDTILLAALARAWFEATPRKRRRRIMERTSALLTELAAQPFALKIIRVTATPDEAGVTRARAEAAAVWAALAQIIEADG